MYQRGVCLVVLVGTLTACGTAPAAPGASGASIPVDAALDATSSVSAALVPVDAALDATSSVPAVVLQDEQAAQAADTALHAQQTGLPVEQVDQAMAFQDAFAAYADDLRHRYPEQIAAVWVEPIPNAKGHVQFIAEVPPEVTAELATLGLLNPTNVVLTSEGGIGLDDHFRRADLAALALADLGYRNFITFFDQDANVIQIELLLPEGAAPPDHAALIRAAQQRVQAEPQLRGRAARVEEHDIVLTIFRGSGPMMTFD